MNLPELESDTDEHLQEKWGGIDLPLKLQVESQQNLSTFLETTCPLNANTTGAAFPVTKKTSETEPLSRPKSIIWGERLSRRPLAAHNCLQNPQSHICGLLQNLAEQFQLLTAIAQTGSPNELCGGLNCD